ncbi:MAG: response regulator transcription factor [Burkholderiaceae bacterium]|jgi:two-component system OmpR family response regulator|nr:response regulator transcription factor [Burkholderiaceae bacterium]
MRVLIVEDDAELARGLQAALREAGMVAETCPDGDQARALGCVERYDAAVLDLGLPRQDGISVLRHWREQGQGFPVLVLTARGRWSDKLDAFQAGADDYLTKPFLHEEVQTRLRVLHRRSVGNARPVLRIGPLSYDTTADRFTLDGKPLGLTAQEQRILAHLASHHGQLVSRADIAEHVYARDLDPDSNTLDVLISRIRRKLAPHALIHTERGRGFRLQGAENAQPPQQQC